MKHIKPLKSITVKIKKVLVANRGKIAIRILKRLL